MTRSIITVDIRWVELYPLAKSLEGIANDRMGKAFNYGGS
jgi:hypothetical protein